MKHKKATIICTKHRASPIKANVKAKEKFAIKKK